MGAATLFPRRKISGRTTHANKYKMRRGKMARMSSTNEPRHQALIDLGARLEASIQPDAVLPALVRAVALSLDVPYVGVTIKRIDMDVDEVAAEYRAADDAPTLRRRTLPDDCVEGEPMRLAVTYQGEPIGELIVAPCASGEPLSSAELELLGRVVHQVGPAAHVVRISSDLRRARERLVLAREEERRRLRHNLHDSIGPTLAALDLKVGAVRNLLAREPGQAEEKLVELRQQIRAVIADIRRVVYNLRPPALDELGMLPAIREQAAQFSMEGLMVRVDAPDSLPTLPAAIEVAIYRIVLEALTNVHRHAQARNCWIALRLGEQAFDLSVSDDGVGLTNGKRAGVGVTSMRERVGELGGSIHIDARPGGGTRVQSRIPLDVGSFATRIVPAG